VTARPKGSAELEDFEVVFSALAHRARRTILSVLHASGGEMTSGAIAAWFEHSWPTTSQHLRVLQQAGLVTIELRGREHVYRLATDRLLTVTRNWLSHFD
jgi:DNA-binding transcriptional ArsR family regulator